MAEKFNDDTIYTQGILALEEKLGPVETLRFLALVSRRDFDYQHWRQEYFGRKSLDEILSEAREIQQ